LGQADLFDYEMNLKIYRDYKSTIDTAFDEGKLEGKREIARSAKLMGLDTEAIMKLTGLSQEEIENL
jgi:predicted transposase/invertase (TIGR01784 family)